MQNPLLSRRKIRTFILRVINRPVKKFDCYKRIKKTFFPTYKFSLLSRVKIGNLTVFPTYPGLFIEISIQIYSLIALKQIPHSNFAIYSVENIQHLSSLKTSKSEKCCLYNSPQSTIIFEERKGPLPNWYRPRFNANLLYNPHN
jgi:hypothetical protein